MSSIAYDRRFTTGAASEETGGYPALWDWRRQMAALYASVRAEPDPERSWAQWRTGKDRLFGTHSQSPIETGIRRNFGGLRYFPYDPQLRFAVGLTLVDEPPMSFDAGNDGALLMRPFAYTDGLAERLGKELTLFWLTGYGGGVFLPFMDATSGTETYGGGRYILDTIKSADLGENPSGELILDFNFAYNPSCCYSPRYVCPLAPATNRLALPVRAGELAPVI
jgi:uncharacterized protein (DUF1684 family)